jgi:hypothetical protein
MSKIYKLIFFLFLTNILISCQSLEDGFSLKKKNEADVFLVEKKNPLVVPPDFGELPLPDDAVKPPTNLNQFNKNNLFEDNENKSIEEKNKTTSNIESYILNKVE